MNKILVIVGILIFLIGTFLAFADMTLGWWQYTQNLTTIIGDSGTKYYLSPFEIISNDANSDTTKIEGYVLLIASIGTMLGVMIVVIGGCTNKNMVIIINITHFCS